MRLEESRLLAAKRACLFLELRRIPGDYRERVDSESRCLSRIERVTFRDWGDFFVLVQNAHRLQISAQSSGILDRMHAS